MTPNEYFKSRTKAEIEAVCEKAGIKYSWFRQIAYSEEKPSLKASIRLVKASGGAMTLEEIRPDAFDVAEAS